MGETAAQHAFPHGLRRMVGRDPLESHRAATPLELLFDLTLVVAFAQAGDQLAHYVAEGHLAAAISGFAFVVFAITWAWLNLAWFASAFDTNDWLQRLLTMVQMIGVLVIALGIPAIFHSIDAGEPIDNGIVVVGYVVMRVAMVAMWLRVAVQDPQYRRIALRYALFIGIVQIGWIVVALLTIESLPLLVAVIVLLWTAELAAYYLATYDRKAPKGTNTGTPWHPHHIVERFGLLVIITLGEGILGTIAVVSALVENVGWSLEAVLIVIAGVGLTFGLWWSYFIIPSAPVLARWRDRSWAWGYGHIVLFGAVAAVGAGLHVAAYAAEGHIAIGNVGVVLAVAIPVALFGVVYFGLYSLLLRAVDSFHLLLAAGMVVLLALAVVLAAVGVSLGWCLIVVMLAPFVVAVGYETVGYRHVEADIAREA